VPLAGLAYGHVLDLNLPRVTGAGQLEVADDLAVRDGDQDAADVDVGVEFGGGILGQLEQRAQVVPWPAVGLDADVVGRTGRHHISSQSLQRQVRRPMSSPTGAELYLRGCEPPARGGRTPIRPVPGNHDDVTSWCT